MARPCFATPLPQSTRSDVLEWRFPRPYDQYVLTGKSRAAWHTSFVIPQLNLLLDAGLCVSKLRPKQIFLTHGHSDHTLLSPAFVKRENPPDIYCPVEMKQVFDNFILAKTMLNLGGLVTDDDAPESDPESRMELSSTPVNGNSTRKSWLNTHFTHGVQHGDVVSLRFTKNITATVFECDHSVPCVGYVFSTTSRRLKPEYSSLAGTEIKALRQAGIEVTSPHSEPIFAFLGDTTAATLAAEPAWLRDGIPVVITECSFLYDEHKAQADKTKHTLWSDLEKVIRRWPCTTFVLMHFSLRYSDEHIRAFFGNMENPPSNIVIWADGESL
jgi:ribonuclease Z